MTKIDLPKETDHRKKVVMKLTFCSRKFFDLSEHIYFYREIVNSFEAMRKSPSRSSKGPYILKREKENANNDAKIISKVNIC